MTAGSHDRLCCVLTGVLCSGPSMGRCGRSRSPTAHRVTIWRMLAGCVAVARACCGWSRTAS